MKTGKYVRILKMALVPETGIGKLGAEPYARLRWQFFGNLFGARMKESNRYDVPQARLNYDVAEWWPIKEK